MDLCDQRLMYECFFTCYLDNVAFGKHAVENKYNLLYLWQKFYWVLWETQPLTGIFMRVQRWNGFCFHIGFIVCLLTNPPSLKMATNTFLLFHIAVTIQFWHTCINYCLQNNWLLNCLYTSWNIVKDLNGDLWNTFSFISSVLKQSLLRMMSTTTLLWIKCWPPKPTRQTQHKY